MRKILSLFILAFAPFYIFSQSITIPGGIQNLGSVTVGSSSSGTFSVTISATGMDPGETIWVESNNPQYEVSTTSGSGFSSFISFTCDGSGDLAATSVYIRFTPTQRGLVTGYFIDVYDDNFYDFQSIRATGRGVAPEIDVLGNSVIIANNDVTPSLTDHTDFGGIAFSSGNIDRTFTIMNVAGETLNDGNLVLKATAPNYVTISGSTDFTVQTQPSSGTIARDSNTTTFVVRFDPSSTGTKTATVTILNNDLDEGTFNFEIEGEGIASAPTVTTSSISSITSSTSAGGGNVTSDGGATVSARGVCWNTSTDPTTSNSHTTDGNGTGSYSSSLTSLVAETHYYVRAYATNSGGTAYGSNEEFWTLSTEPSTQASSVVCNDKTGSTIDLSWSAATGADGYIILQRSGATAPTTTGVVDGMAYGSFTGLPVGTTVAAEASSATYEITGLSASTQYSFTIIPFAKGANDATYNYKIDGTLATKTETTVSAAPTTQASGIKYGTTVDNKMEIAWDAGNGDGQILLMKANSAASDPINGTNYTGSTTFGSGDEIGAGTFVIYRGSGAKGRVYVENLDPGTEYFFKVFEYSGTGSQTAFNMTETGGYNSGNSMSSSLPIELLSFSATALVDGVQINWATSSEVNNDFFVIEKSTNLTNWEIVEIVDGAGNSNTTKEYQATDPYAPNAQIVYYRLKQVDFDAQFSYSDIIFITSSTTSQALSVSNPFKSGEMTQAIIYGQADVALQLEVINLLGHVVYRESFQADADVHIHSFDLSKYSKGAYLLRISNGNDFKVIKFINF